MRRLAAAVVLALAATPVLAKMNVMDSVLQYARSTTAKAPEGSVIETAFSPKGGGQELVIKTIDSAQQTLHVMAYSFTSAPITSALLRAKKRGVNVYLIADYENNLRGKSETSKARAAFNALVNAGIPVRVTSAFAIHHDKVVIADSAHVQTGSFNYSQAADRSNSENVIVIWNNKPLAASYLQHWQRNWGTGTDYRPGY